MLCETCKATGRIVVLQEDAPMKIIPCPECGDHRFAYCCEGQSLENGPETRVSESNQALQAEVEGEAVGNSRRPRGPSTP